MEKLLAMNVAATLAGAVLSNLEDNLTVDVEIKNETLRAENLMCWELFRVFYHAVRRAAEDEQSWPAPAVRHGDGFAGLLQKLAPLVTGSGPFADIARQLLAAIPTPPAATTPGRVPDPGV